MRRLVFLLCASSGVTTVMAQEEHFCSSADVIREINLARQKPATYANWLEERPSRFRGTMYLAPGAIPLRTQEGARAVDEAIHFLRTVPPVGPLALSPGMCRAAADHCRDQATGRTGHDGSDRSNPGQRISRYGAWSGRWGENISYGHSSAREVVIALIVDDGVRGRGHRQNLFSPSYNVAGAALGSHPRFGTVCSIDFAGAFLENSVAQRGAPIRPEIVNDRPGAF